eukprot:4225245-Pyramimonas_sp.AAC.1
MLAPSVDVHETVPYLDIVLSAPPPSRDRHHILDVHPEVPGGPLRGGEGRRRGPAPHRRRQAGQRVLQGSARR